MRVEPTHYAEVFVAGDRSAAEDVCRKFCFAHPLCVTVEAVKFIYTGGQEDGVKVGLTNYPRFPTSPTSLLDTALALAEMLRAELSQWSYMVRCADKTYWHSGRPE